MLDFNKTHCDKCKSEVGKGFGIYATGGFYHRYSCWEDVKQGCIDSYERDELKTSLEREAVCPYCGYVERNSWELSGDDGENICGRCEKEYSYTRNVEVTYTTTKKDVKQGGSWRD